MEHAHFEDRSQQVRDAGFTSSRFDASVSGNLFFERDSDCAKSRFHDANMVSRELPVNTSLDRF
jgi:hypothetical protein